MIGMNEMVRVSDGYSFMTVSAYGTSMYADNRRKSFTDWVAIASGVLIAILIMNIVNMPYPAVIIIPILMITMFGVVFTLAKDLIRKMSIKLACDNTHLPILINYINRNIRFSPKQGEVAPLQVFKNKYRCKQITEKGRRAFQITGVPTSEMKEFVKRNSPRVGTLVFSISRICLVYVCSSNGEDPIGDVLERFSANRITIIQQDKWQNH